MKIAIEGCAHGELEKIYKSIQYLEQREKVKVDLLICCGDFQSTRNIADLRCMACPIKYQNIGSFYKYYTGQLVAPVLTIFIGGNHEASNYLQELAYGGWVAPNIYYMGYAGVISVAGIRIAGISGIYKGHDFLKGHFEMSPYTEDTKRSVYHIRNLEVFRLKQLTGAVDICLSHDWPRGVYHYGNIDELLQKKPFFREDIASNKLGSAPCDKLLHYLKPSYWFAAHLHCKFAALIPHHDDEQKEVQQTTKFLALDKCLPRRNFLQVIDIPHDNTLKIELSYDLEWLSILNVTNHLLSLKSNYCFMPDSEKNSGRYNFTPTEEEKQNTLLKFNNDLKIPLNFVPTAEAYDPSNPKNRSSMPIGQTNPQTETFCEKLCIDDPTCLMSLNSNTSNVSLNSTLSLNLTPECDSHQTYTDLSCSTNVVESPKSCVFIPAQVERKMPDIARKLNLSLPAPKLSPIKDDNSSEKPLNLKRGSLDLAEDHSFSKTSVSPEFNVKPCVKISNDVDCIADEHSPKQPKQFKRRNGSLYNASE